MILSDNDRLVIGCASLAYPLLFDERVKGESEGRARGVFLRDRIFTVAHFLFFHRPYRIHQGGGND